MMMKSKITVQWAALPRAGVRKSHVKAAIKHSMPAHIEPVERPDAGKQLGSIVSATVLAASLMFGGPAEARMEGVNRPELLPPGPVTPVIDVAGFLTDGQEARIKARAEALEEDTGLKLRVLAQNYPETPGLAIKDYWGVDADTVVFVADPNTGNILNFNVGDNVDLSVPRTFWSRLAGRFGTKFYWRDNGEDAAIVNAVAAIDNCLREPLGKLQCNTIRGELE
ncbi:putative Thylakoid lumenal 15.0 kDa protein 2, chloroplastic [Nannochloris sp. 'desiccata']|nr:hypothetical protein KSW81_001986 [Chlorella desiccata (nom. nud.)]KAH7622538.1 putative Thylakoid lumenal 15.0 kDa protein 2, chloroplastic [Chlorella desiccata (nom. nud.)]